MDGLPLALSTAGAYLDQVALSVSDYLRLYKESWIQLHKSGPELSSYDETLYSTWNISYDHVKQENDLSAKLLCFWAYFDSQDIWLELLQHDDSDTPDWVRQLVKDKISFHKAMRVLSSHGLVEVHASPQELVESSGYSMHGCVHSWTINVLNQTWDYGLASLAVGFVASHVPEEGTDQPWLLQQRLIQHAIRCSYILLNDLLTDTEMEWAWYNIGSLYDQLGKNVEAETMYQTALQKSKKVWGPEHTQTLNIVNNLGLLYVDQNKLTEAEPMYQAALQGYEKIWGPDHSETLDVVNNLGLLYMEQGKLAEAEQMYQRALQGKEKELGPGHARTLDIVNNLGLLYTEQGKLVEAEQMYQRALQGKEKELGPERIKTSDTFHNLGILYENQGKLVEAEEMYQKALKGYEKVVGTNNVTTYRPELETIFNLGSLFEDQDDWAKARVYYSKALVGYEKVLGPDHAQTQELQDLLHDLDVKEKNKTLELEKEPSNDPLEASAEETPSVSKRQRLV